MFNYDHIKYSPYLMLKKYNMPVLPRSCFSKKKNTFYGNGEELNKALSYIEHETEYDADNIWQDLLCRVNISIIKDNLGLNYVISQEAENELTTDKKIVVIAHLYYDDMADECFMYLSNIPDEIDVIVTSSKKELLDRVKRYAERNLRNIFKTRLVPNRGRDVGAIFVACRDIAMEYDYLCFVHDKKTSGGRGLITTGASFHNMVWENMLSSSGYIKNVISLFEKNRRLGLLSPPIPIHSGYEMLLPYGWSLNYENTKEEVRKLGLKVPVDEKNQPFAFSTCFWCRTDALKKMWEFDLKIEDFKESGQDTDGELNHALERVIIYVAQDAGYYSAILENKEYASIMQQNLYVHLRKQLRDRDKRYTKRNNKRLAKYLNDKETIYVYGAGIEGEKAKRIIEEAGFRIDAFAVSDEYFDGCDSKLSPLIKLSDIRSKNAGIIIAMNKINETEARKNLDKMGIDGAISLFMKE